MFITKSIFLVYYYFGFELLFNRPKDDMCLIFVISEDIANF